MPPGHLSDKESDAPGFVFSRDRAFFISFTAEVFPLLFCFNCPLTSWIKSVIISLVSKG